MDRVSKTAMGNQRKKELQKQKKRAVTALGDKE